MNIGIIPALYELALSWNLRNVYDAPRRRGFKGFYIAGVEEGKYPIDAWKPYLLEIPQYGHKKDIVGRCYHAFGIGLKNTEWDRKRTVVLPKYVHGQYPDKTLLKALIRNWTDVSISDDIPCISIAVKCRGYYAECREAQSVMVLVVWNDAVCRILSLDWAEGPIEDCITPEWFVETTNSIDLTIAVKKMQRAYANVQWDNMSFSVYPIPSFLGHCLHGEMVETTYLTWKHEWRYSDYIALREDLIIISKEIADLFSEEGGELLQ